MNKVNCKFFKDGKCLTDFPDSLYDCEPKYCQCKEQEKVMIEGVGKDAEIIVNEKGGKQSKSPMAAHLIDPEFLYKMIDEPEHIDLTSAIEQVGRFMSTGVRDYLLNAVADIEPDDIQALIRIAKVLQEGVGKYEPNNWRLIPQEEHINHVLIHLFAAVLGDTQDNHTEHALCRLMMAYATETSPNFSYTQYIQQEDK